MVYKTYRMNRKFVKENKEKKQKEGIKSKRKWEEEKHKK